MSRYTLLGIPGSPFVRKASVFMMEKGIDFGFEFVNIFPVPKGFEKLNPMKRVPVLKLPSGQHLADSSAICQFLERKHPDVPMYPTDDLAFATALMWEEYADTELAHTVGMGVFRPLVLSQMRGKEVDLERVAKVVNEKLPPMFQTLTDRLGDQPFFGGQSINIVDIAVATQLVNLDHAGVSVDAGRFGALAAFVDTMFARPSFKKLIGKEKSMMPPAIALPA